MFSEKLKTFFRPDFATAKPPESGMIEIHARLVPILFRRHPRARRYLLRLRADQTVVVTVPRGGSLEFARQFAVSRRSWLEKQWRILEARPAPPPALRPGMEAMLRGRRVALEARERDGRLEIWFDNQRVQAGAPEENLRPALEEHLRALARRELAERAEELARQHAAPMRRVIGAQSKEPLGVLLRPRDHFAELEVGAGSRGRARLHHPARIDAFAASEPFRAVLGGRGTSLPGLSLGGNLAKEPLRGGGILRDRQNAAKNRSKAGR